MACVVTLALFLFAGFLCASPVHTDTELVSTVPDHFSRSGPMSHGHTGNHNAPFSPHMSNDHQSTTTRSPAVYGGVDNPYRPCSDYHVPVYGGVDPPYGPCSDYHYSHDPVKTQAAVLQSRESDSGNDYAMVCGSDSHRFTTNTCAGSPFRYYCTGQGRLARKGSKNSHCSEVCRCVNLAPKPCLHGVVAAKCYVSDDGLILDSNLDPIGQTSIATQLGNGTWVIHSEAEGEGDSHELEMRAESGKGNPATTTMAISHRDANAAMHDYALVCADRGGTGRCQDRSYYCTSSGKVAYKLSDYFCDTVCECKNLRARPKACANLYEADLHKFVCFDDADTDAPMNVTEDEPLNQDISTNLTIDDSGLSARDGLGRREVTDPGCHPQTLSPRSTWLLLCQNHTQVCNAEFGYCCHSGTLTAASHNPICNDICQCVSSTSNILRYCTHGPNFSILSECFVIGNAIYKLEGELLTDFLGNFTSAVVGPCGNLWVGEPGMSSYPPFDVSPPQITDAVNLPPPETTHTVVKRGEAVSDMAQDKWLLGCQNKAHTQTCRNKLHYSCDGAKVVHQDYDFVCEAICVCYDQEPNQVCVPRHSISGLCPPGVVLDPPADGSETDMSIVNEDQDSKGSGALAVSVRSSDDSKKDEPWYFICKTKDTVNISLTNRCWAKGYTCPRYPPHGSEPKPTRPEPHDPLCENHSSCHCRQSSAPSQDEEAVMIEGDLSASNSLFVPALVSREAEKDLPADRKYFSLTCNNGKQFNASLTKICAEHSYRCVPGEVLSALEHDGPIDAQCSENCHCRSPFAAAEEIATRSFGYELLNNQGYTLRCGQEADQFYRTSSHVLSTRCEVIWGYSCGINGQVQHGGAPVFKCEETCSCHKSNNSTVVGA
ncbi:hypothetical protein PV08_00261 [Exophiala spinifera]|uniref:Cyanovirin-N domain-containing protein n=1 Tax=Exophiala spinifera TaxID=91928 RepID=A0A0D2A4B0_9EURO|nr:uncharacterized protein PV08_00261 [Exophiala spinifera]KIW19687.1 hypothetical protein PV08_00261 [Exophiala spinifera]